MSASTTAIDSSIPLPADLRSASPDRQSAWRAAASFEQVLVEQLVKPMADDLGGEDGPYGDELTSAMAGAVMDGGGLGLASALAAGLDRDGKTA